MNSIRNNPNPAGPNYCFRGVKHHLRNIGVNLQGGSAHQAADQLANNPRFREIRVSRAQLRSLPAGAIVVWGQNPNRRATPGDIHGHISISLGNGREASDRIRNQMVNTPRPFRVFIPSDMGGQQQQQTQAPRHIQA